MEGKKWEKFQEFLENGDWHTHTTYSDGNNTVFEMCEQAKINGLGLIAVTDHVRKDIDYNFSDLVRDVKNARNEFKDLNILVGCEAKILPDGDIDVSDDVLRMCDIVIASFHGFPHGKGAQINALKIALNNPVVDIWGHPGTMFRNFDPNLKEICDMIEYCMNKNVLIEKSLWPDYTPPKEFIVAVEKLDAKIVISSDAHSIHNIRKMSH
jgi:DNA polymerase (family 10)/putative hydrolase